MQVDNDCGPTVIAPTDRHELPVGRTTRSFPTVASRWATLVTWVAVLAPLPYSILRILWAAGLPVGITGEGLRELGSPGWGSLGMLGLAGLTGGTAGFVYAFVLSRAETVPRWLPVVRGRPVRPWMVIALLLLPIAMLAYANAITAAGLFGLLEFADRDPHLWVTGILFAVWGPALTAAVFIYYRDSRRLGEEHVGSHADARAATQTRDATELVSARPLRSFAWAGYAASGWAVAYAVGVRGYQGLGGMLGLPGTFEDPDAVRRASLVAGAGILLVGLASLALVRPWGVRFPRWLLVVPALAGSVIALTHALTAYVTKPLHLVGLIDLEFKGWVQLDEGKLILWDLLFYEPWFLGLGLLVTLAAVHHHRRTGGSALARRRLVLATAAATVVWTAVACAQLISAQV